MTQWRTGMKLTKARLDDGSAITWTTGEPVRADQLREAYVIDVWELRAGDELDPVKLDPS